MKAYLLLALVVLAGIVPFASRAVFMDEHIFLQLARNVPQHPLFPQETASVFFGIPLQNFAGHTHGPVAEYYLALIYAVVGHFSEVPFRLAFSVFSIAAVLAFFFLAKRFTEQPFLVTLVFALSPAFFVMSPTLMMDIPALAFLLVGIAFYFSHLEGSRYGLSAAAVCFVLAAGTSYTVLVPLGCLFLQMLASGRPRKELLAVVAAPLALVFWQAAMTAHFGSIPITATIDFYKTQMGGRVHKIAATLSFLGMVSLFPGMALVVSEGWRRKTIVFAAAITVLLAVAAGPWYALAAGSGLLLIAAFARTSRGIMASGRNRGEGLFILWVPATLLFFILIADMINARYILLALPALLLILCRNSTRRQLTTALIPTALLSVCVAYADSVFVNSYRDWVNKTIVPLQTKGFRIWSGAESGLRFYLEQHGIETLTAADLRPAGTDLVVQHDLFRYGLSADVGPLLIRLKRVTLNSSFPLRTFNVESGAGFHDSRIGLTPFTISTASLDRIDISEMDALVTGLPQHGVPAEDFPAWSSEGPILRQHVDQLEFKVKIPADSKLEYELMGQGTAETTADRIILRRLSPGTIVWRNVRFVPLQE